MFEEAVGKIKKLLEESAINAGYPKFSGKGYRTYKIDAGNFHDIKKSRSGRKIAYVDGGNAEIIATAGFSLILLRVSLVIYQDNKKISVKRLEIPAFVQATSKDGEIHYDVSSLSRELDGIDRVCFSSMDFTLMQGSNRAEMGSVSSPLRRFAELRMAKWIADERAADIIVLDGNLQKTVSNEKPYLDELHETCSKYSVILSALSKTSSLFMDNGVPISTALDLIGPSRPWFYHPVADINNPEHRAEMFFAKFHEKSRHVFRFEISIEQREKAEETIEILAANSVDPVFIGYPYGLVEADRIARIGNQEKESLKTMILAKLGGKNIEKHLGTKNAHEILDRIRF